MIRMLEMQAGNNNVAAEEWFSRVENTPTSNYFDDDSSALLQVEETPKIAV